MKALRLASFGIRGFVGQTLTPTVAINMASAFATFAHGGRILVGRDTRHSSPMLHSAVLSGLLSAGCDVLDLGICPTPLVQFAVRRLEAAGAISISGGHNAAGWNALTLLGADGAFLEPLGGEEVLDIFHTGDFLRKGWREMGTVRPADDGRDGYFDALEAAVDTEAIRRAGYTVLIDPVGGAGCPYLETFSRRFGFTLMPINGEPSGYLAREPEPRPRSAIQMASMIPHVNGDVGFVLSSDMGRLSLVTESGEPTSEEYTFAVIANHILKKQKGSIVTNSCTTRMMDDIARDHGVELVKTRVGQAFVVASLADEQGVVGGEGSGSVVLPSFSPAYDGFLMMALVMEAMAVNQAPLSKLLRGLPRYHIVKKSVPCAPNDGYRALERLEEQWHAQADRSIERVDGMRLDWEDGWIHARTSRTEQMVRVISEATSYDVAERRAEQVIRIVEQH